MIPCSDVIVGKWRRMNSGNNDLLVYLSEAKRTITYYIRSVDMGFKMRVSFDSVVATEYANDIAPGSDRMSLLLNKPPTFFREVASPANSSMRTWQPASDWTEGAQASMYTRHEIIGPSGYLGSAFAPLLNSGTCLSSITRSSTPNGLTAPSDFHASPSLSYSPSSAGGTASTPSTSSPPRHISPVPYISNLAALHPTSRPGSSSSLPDSVDFALRSDHKIRNENSRSPLPPPISFPPDHFTPSNPSYPFGHNSQYSQPSTGSSSSTSSIFDNEFDSPFPGGPSSFSSTVSGGLSTPLSFDGAVSIPRGGYMDHQPSHLQVAHLHQASLPSSDGSPLDYEFGYPMSDIDLLPENFPGGVSRPTSSAGSFGGKMEVAPLAKSWTAGTVAMNIPMRRSSGSDAGGSRGATLAGQPLGGPRFMDLYSSKSLNLASYILGGQGEIREDSTRSLSPSTSTHSDIESQPFPPPQRQFAPSVWTP